MGRGTVEGHMDGWVVNMSRHPILLTPYSSLCLIFFFTYFVWPVLSGRALGVTD
jgi:hypothetical protein